MREALSVWLTSSMDTNTTPTGFDVNPNGSDLHLRCRACGESKAGSGARAWAYSHTHEDAPTAPTRLVLTDSHGRGGFDVVVPATEAAETAAIEFLKRVTAHDAPNGYLVLFDVEGGDMGALLEDFLYPKCEHGLSLRLCAGPGHYPSDL